MFIGHYGVSFVAATQPKAPPLGTLFVAAQLIDFGFFGFLIAGIEKARLVPGMTAMNPMDLYWMPWTHSLVGAIAWSVGLAILILMLTRSTATAAIGGIVVLSHWVIDLLVHTQDLTIIGTPPKFGFGLWNYPLIEMPLELFFAYGGLAWYLSRTHATGAAGRFGPWLLALVMAGLQAFNWFGPQPTTIIDPPPVEMAPLGLFAYVLMAAIAWWMASGRDLRVKPGH
ncbi:hypothetical protein [Sphingomonas sp. 28-62-11]|uniref:hypothetical protein n=1 Tax=Sphingomonas sp. 28-62-11 TaxID=1970432 RepID=UPI000BD45B04|nr:MAG: hypothetical protein B7Y49_14155 [Sphingomonas sp. 28-62-11]